MAAKYLLHIACISLSILTINAVQTVNGKIKITIGTTAGCVDTVNFIHNQLKPTYAKYKEYLELDFLPWGRTRRNDDGTWWCQFSPHNCWANRLHRCALSQLPDQDAQLSYMTCEFTAPSASWNEGSYRCAHEAGLSLVDIDHCVANPGDQIDVEAERRGTEIIDITDFVPSTVFNDNIDKQLNDDAFSGLETIICFALADDPTTNVDSCQF